MSDRYESLLAVAGPVSRETYEIISGIEADLKQWNDRINLVSASTLADGWQRHILDSAQLIGQTKLDRHWLDLGSGAGLPGLVIAALLRERPGARIDLVESNRKKSAFIQMVIGKYALPARVHAVRIEAFPRTPTDVITARALAPLSKLLELAEPWLVGDTRAFFHKGRDYAVELSEAIHRWSFDVIELRSAVDAAGVILEISNLRRRL